MGPGHHYGTKMRLFRNGTIHWRSLEPGARRNCQNRPQEFQAAGHQHVHQPQSGLERNFRALGRIRTPLVHRGPSQSRQNRPVRFPVGSAFPIISHSNPPTRHPPSASGFALSRSRGVPAQDRSPPASGLSNELPATGNYRLRKNSFGR